jgi:hypothetical protein
VVELLILAAVGAVICVIPNWIRLFGSGEENAYLKQRVWQNRRLAQGASWDDIRAESGIREHLAMLRESVSDHVRNGGKENWEEFMHSEIRGSMMVLSVLDPSIAKRFYDIVRQLRHSDILYPAEYEMIYPTPKVHHATPEERARWARVRNAAYTDL